MDGLRVFLPALCLDSDGILHSAGCGTFRFVGLLFAGLRRVHDWGLAFSTTLVRGLD